MRGKVEIVGEILSKIPLEVWKKILFQEPEAGSIFKLAPLYGWSHFAVLMIALGLNDYQLKGKAEEVYWPKLFKHLEKERVPASLTELYSILKPFYQKERYNQRKVERLYKFLHSQLAETLWNSNLQEISSKFVTIWCELARTMHQSPYKKTIAFAMKCLAIVLIKANIHNFNFDAIPIPVDLRVQKFTSMLAFPATSNEKIRELWHDVLSIIQKKEPEVSMVYLDSLIWQIASLRAEDWSSYFEKLGIKEVGGELQRLW